MIFFFNDTATTEIYTLSLHDALPISEDDRTEAPLVGDEVTLLTGFLGYQRQTLAWKCAGLTPQQLATRTVPTSDQIGGEQVGIPSRPLPGLPLFVGKKKILTTHSSWC